MGTGKGRNQAFPFLRMRLADLDGRLLVDTQPASQVRDLTNEELESAIPLQVDGETIGYFLPDGNQVFTPASENLLLSRLNQAAIISIAIAGTVAILLALFLSYRLLRPVRALTQAATHLAEGDLSQRVPVHGNDELATLGLTFNRMANSLQQAEESRRALTADIAHELRTPLAVQRAHLEALQDGIYDLTPENLAVIEEQNRMLTRLVDDLRMLALVDAGQLSLERTPTDFSALIQRVTDRFAPQVADRQIKIQLSLDESCPHLNLDAQRIEQILQNLLDNALRYIFNGGQIALQLTCDSNNATLTIHDSGPGIPEDALPYIFERFYRADKSRARFEPVLNDIEGSGTGLGLSIARKLALAHGGDLTASNHPDGGAVFELTLPFNIISTRDD
jgi:two-component system sensor histidine kinase BaeS